MIIKAIVTTNSADDPEGRNRVKIESPTVWENSDETEDYYQCVGVTSLNKGDVVFVYVEDMDFANPIILGKARDNEFKSSVDVGTFTVLYESVVGKDAKIWSIAYVQGTEFHYQNSDEVHFKIVGKELSFEAPKFKLSLDADGNTSIETQGKVTTKAEGESADEPVIFGDELFTQLNKLSARMDKIVNNITNMVSSAAVAPMDGGATFKAAMTMYWQGQTSAMLKQSNESWTKIRNKSITTAGKGK